MKKPAPATGQGASSLLYRKTAQPSHFNRGTSELGGRLQTSEPFASQASATTTIDGQKRKSGRAREIH